MLHGMMGLAGTIELDGKVVLVTGASQGIGRELISVFRGRGSKLVLTARRRDLLSQAAAVSDLVVAADLTLEADRERLIRTVIEERGRIDVLVNNAAAGAYGLMTDLPISVTRQLFELNFFAPLQLVQLAVPAMPPGSAIVNVGSVAGRIVLPWSASYSATKFALDALSDGLRLELTGRGIHVMSVCPGHIQTEFQQHVLAGHPPQLMQTRPRWGTIPASDCARAIVRGLERHARTLVVPWVYWLPIWASRIVPQFVDRQMARLWLEPAGEVDA